MAEERSALTIPMTKCYFVIFGLPMMEEDISMA